MLERQELQRVREAVAQSNIASLSSFPMFDAISGIFSNEELLRTLLEYRNNQPHEFTDGLEGRIGTVRMTNGTMGDLDPVIHITLDVQDNQNKRSIKLTYDLVEKKFRSFIDESFHALLVGDKMISVDTRFTGMRSSEAVLGDGLQVVPGMRCHICVDDRSGGRQIMYGPEEQVTPNDSNEPLLGPFVEIYTKVADPDGLHYHFRPMTQLEYAFYTEISSNCGYADVSLLSLVEG